MDANAPRRRGSAGRTVVVGAAVVALVAVVAAASGGSAPRGSVGAHRPSEGLLDAVLSLFVVAMAVCAVLVAVMLSFFGRHSADGPARKRRSPARSVVSFVVAVALLAVIVRALAGSEGARLRSLAPARDGSGAGSGDGSTARYEPEFAVWPVVGVGLLALLAALAWWLSARGRRASREPARTTPEEALADVLAVTLDDLRAERDPRRAVIGAYARMERALAASGLPRGAAEAPEEYLSRVLDEIAVSRRSAGRLTALFAWARFSGHDVRPEMKDEAIDTLEQVQRELAAAHAALEAERAGAAA
jgi:hypothetical protein